MKREAFSYELPPERIATKPANPRDSARLLVCSRSDRELVAHRSVADLPALLRPNDALVLNETRVLPHRLIGRRASGARVECLLLERNGELATGFLKPSKKLRVGEIVDFEGGAIKIEILEKLGQGRHRLRISVGASRDGDDHDAAGESHATGEDAVGEGSVGEGSVAESVTAEGAAAACESSVDPIAAALERVGRAPLPPYIARGDDEDAAADRELYQTVFAREPGAVAAPTAGLHFTPELLARLEAGGLQLPRVTLHVGEGTFEPLRADEIESHEMHAERYELSPEAAQVLSATRVAGGRIFCVGTTSARVLESCYDPERDALVPGRGETRLFLYPGKGPRYLDGLLTNFHLPESTLLLLVASILGRERTLELYELAIREEYRFYSFGDAMLILP